MREEDETVDARQRITTRASRDHDDADQEENSHPTATETGGCSSSGHVVGSVRPEY